MPYIACQVRALAKAGQKGFLVAWNPVTQRAVWRVEHPVFASGGVLSTAGNLVFQGHAAGQFRAFKADDGQPLWAFDAQSGLQAAPISYSVDGEQYVAVLAGREGALALSAGALSLASGKEQVVSRVLSFKLGGQAQLPPLPEPPDPVLNPPPRAGDAVQVARGQVLYSRYCAVCHGDAAISGRVVRDLRLSPILAEPKLWRRVVLEGALRPLGMTSFAQVLSPADAQAIRAYVVNRAYEDKALMSEPPGAPPPLPPPPPSPAASEATGIKP